MGENKGGGTGEGLRGLGKGGMGDWMGKGEGGLKGGGEREKMKEEGRRKGRGGNRRWEIDGES